MINWSFEQTEMQFLSPLMNSWDLLREDKENFGQSQNSWNNDGTN